MSDTILPFDGDTDFTDEVICPHCGDEFRDSWEFGNGVYDCDRCGLKFEVAVNHRVTYTTTKVDE